MKRTHLVVELALLEPDELLQPEDAQRSEDAQHAKHEEELRARCWHQELESEALVVGTPVPSTRSSVLTTITEGMMVKRSMIPCGDKRYPHGFGAANKCSACDNKTRAGYESGNNTSSVTVSGAAARTRSKIKNSVAPSSRHRCATEPFASLSYSYEFVSESARYNRTSQCYTDAPPRCRERR